MSCARQVARRATRANANANGLTPNSATLTNWENVHGLGTTSPKGGTSRGLSLQAPIGWSSTTALAATSVARCASPKPARPSHANPTRVVVELR